MKAINSSGAQAAAINMEQNHIVVKATTQSDTGIVYFSSEAKWEAWLEKNHSLQSNIWIKIAKKKSGIPTVTYFEALDVALCYGWIDSTRRALDEDYFMQYFCPRRAKSNWSVVNKNKVAMLIESGRMRESGFKVIREAQQDGRWDANDK